jgi:hypothetical protein
MHEIAVSPPAKTSARNWAVPVLAALALGLGLVATPAPAKAEIFIGFSSGHWRHPHHWHYRFIGPPVVFYGPPAYYRPPPPAVYVAPAPVYVPGPIYSEPLRVSPAGPSYRSSNGLTCREYQTTVTVGGQVQNAYGTACLQPDGQWKVVD